MKIGIIGNGFVGNSIAFGFSPTHEIKIYDKDPKRNLNSLKEVLECDYIFVAVPTPMQIDGSISLHLVEKVLQEISDNNKKLNNIIILKSTMIPGSTNNFIKQFKADHDSHQFYKNVIKWYIEKYKKFPDV